MSCFLTRKQISEIYPISYSTLSNLARSSVGPAYGIIAGKALYRREDFESWLQQQLNKSSPSKQPPNLNRPVTKRGRPRKTRSHVHPISK